MTFRSGFVLLAATGALSSIPAFAYAAGGPGTAYPVLDVSHPSGLVDLGEAPADAPVSFAASLAYRNEAELEQLAALQSDPGSPLYGEYLTNEQFNASFAPDRAAYLRVVGMLANAGFTVTKTYANRSVIDAGGTVAVAERFFGTQLHLARQGGYGVRLAAVTPGRMPAEFRGLVTAITGLQTLVLLKPAFATAGARGNVPLGPAKAPPLYGPVSTITGLSGFGPLAFSNAYDLPATHDASGPPLDGRGRVSGVVIDADYLDTDLTAFLSYFHVKRTGPPTARMRVDGGPPTGDRSPDSVETTLDVATIVSNAPGTALVVYEFPGFSNLRYITDAYNAVVDDDLVDTANSSFGGCEDAIRGAARAWNELALQGAVKGITFHASSGDGGDDPCGTGGLDVIAPASGPHFAAIGGTSLSVNAQGGYVSETVWNSVGAAAGGGVSDVFAIPSYQVNIPHAVATGRNLPDVSFDADPLTGTAFYYGGTWNNQYNPLGGTSLSSPIFGAAVTQYDEVLGRRSGLAAVALYRFWKTNGYRGPNGPEFFRDVKSGCNGIGGGGFCATPGFDQASGIGSVDWYNVLRQAPDDKDLVAP
jgi:kumamolisin